MDPVTQGVLGAVVAQQPAKRKHFITATCLGVFSGMVPDADVLIRSSVDPLLSLEFHRQFTHSLFFIPIGALLCALAFYFLFAKRQELSFKQTYLYCVLGYATHGLLDACTTYGTLLLWPFSDMRVAWNTISIIDPLFTLPLLFLVLFAAIKRCRRFAHIALAWVAIYSGLGVIQRERAETAGLALAESRGHVPVTLEAKPSFANLLVWKIIYTTDTRYYVDGVRVGFATTVIEGDSITKLNVAEAFPWLNAQSQQARDIERFRWFSNGYIALSPRYPNRIIDIRYSLLPNEIQGLWGVELDAGRGDDEHINYVSDRERSEDTFVRLWQMIVGK